MISLIGVTKSFQEVAAIKSLDLEIPKGKTTVLLGTSGCGKSTILRLMVGLLYPDQGEIYFNNEIVSPSSIADLRRRVGYVIQEGGLFPHLTARQNVTLMADFLCWSKAKQEERLTILADLTRIDAQLLDRHPIQLSGGERQRISLMRALMLVPEVLLLDEPLGALDPITRSDLQQDLKRVFETLQKTVVLVTHDLGEAFFLGDYIVLLQNGEIVQAGTGKDLVERPASPFVTRFLNAQRVAAFDQRNLT